jgi:glucarate dehydratase
MLLNLCGAYGPIFTRNIVILKDNSGHTGVCEVPGGEEILQTLKRTCPLVVGQSINQGGSLRIMIGMAWL